MRRLTPGQLEVLQCIEEFIEANGYAPTLDEIAQHLDISKPTVQQYLQTLEEKGAIARKRYAHRSIEVVARKDATGKTELPLLGRIAAGEPIEAVEDRELVDVVEVLGASRGKDLFLLQVRGDSMIEEGIFDGDYVVVEKRETATNGETVVALLPDNTATLKKFYKEKNRIRLQPANPALKPMTVREVVIQGVVRGVVRRIR